MKASLDYIDQHEEKSHKHCPKAFDPIIKKPMSKRQSPVTLRSKSPPACISHLFIHDHSKRASPRLERNPPTDHKDVHTTACKSRTKLNTELRIKPSELVEHPEIRTKTELLIEKVIKGDIEGVVTCLTKTGVGKPIDINYKRSDGWTALHMACEEGHFRIACTLIKFGALIDSQNIFKRTPLHIACIKYSL